MAADITSDPSQLERAISKWRGDLDDLTSKASAVNAEALERSMGGVATRLDRLAGRLGDVGELSIGDRIAAQHLGKQAEDLASTAIGSAVDPDKMADLTARAARSGSAMAAETGGLPTIAGAAAKAHEAAVAAVWGQGSPLKILLADLGPQMGSVLGNKITDGVLLGLNPRKVAADALAQVNGLTARRASNIARTEMARAHRAAAADRINTPNPNVQGWVWTSAADARTCVACWAMHGTKHRKSDTLDGHPSCRCTMVPLVVGGAADQIPEGGDLIRTRLSADKIRATLGPTRYERWAAGEWELPDMVERTTSARWGTMRRTRTVRDTPTAVRARTGVGT